MQVHIDVGSAADLADVLALARADPDLPLWTAEAWQMYAEPDPTRPVVLLLARASDGQILGCLAASGFDDAAELDLLFVHPTNQKQGIGGQLMRFWLAWAQTRGVREVVLEVRASNTAAIQLYSKVGFAAQGRRRNYYQAPVEDAILMRAMLLETGSGTEVEGPGGGTHRV